MSGPSWEVVAIIAGTIITILISIVISLIAGYTKALGRRLESLEVSHRALNDKVLSQYHDKNETNTLLSDVKASVSALHQRFDLILAQSTPKG
jgi:Tfp pilus assembly protein PilO